MSIRIVTDSSCDLPTDMVRENEIEIVPLTVLIDGREYQESVNLDGTEFARLMRNSKELPKTSQPSPHAFLSAFEQVTKTAESAVEVLCLTLSSKLSGTFQSACAAAKRFAGTASVIDSKSGTIGLGIMVLEAKRLVQSGLPLAEITAKLEAMREQLSVFVSLDTLENAVKGGRLRRVEATVAQLLKIKVFLRVNDGAVEVCGRTRGKKNVIAGFLDAMQAKAVDYRNRIVGISHVDNEEGARALAERITERFHPAQVIITPMGSTIATHAGLGALVLAY